MWCHIVSSQLKRNVLLHSPCSYHDSMLDRNYIDKSVPDDMPKLRTPKFIPVVVPWTLAVAGCL